MALTYDKTSGSAYLYCNGAVAASANLGANICAKTSANLYFGYRRSSGNRFTGMMDEISLYNSALSQTAIQGIYMCGSAGKVPQIPQ